jgi:microcystin-dependent protein
MMNKRAIASLTAFLLSTTNLQSATLLPNGQQQFLNGNGQPYASGRVFFYSNFPTCTVLKNTWSNSGQTVLNTNPVVLDAAGRATIFGSGSYCQVLKDSNNNTIWTKETGDATSTSNLGWGSTSGGTANAQTVSVAGFSNINGQTFYFVAGATNTGPLTLSVNAGSPLSVVKETPTGSQLLVGAEVVSGNVIGVTYVSVTGNLRLVTNNNITPAGQIATYGSTTCPAGWLAAQGQAVAISTYSSLFSALGTNWNVGGEGAGNFRIPDLRGMFVRGTGTNATGSSTGAVGPAVGGYVADTYLNHNHTATQAAHNHTYTFTTVSGTSGGFAAVGSAYTSPTVGGTTASATPAITVATSTTGGTETKPKNYGVLYCIKF